MPLTYYSSEVMLTNINVNKYKICFDLYIFTTKRKWAHQMEIRQGCWHLNIDDSNTFYECYSFNGILDYRKMGKYLPNIFITWLWIEQHEPFHTKIDNFNFCSLKNLQHELKKKRDDQEIIKKLFFCFSFVNCRLAQWYRVSWKIFWLQWFFFLISYDF